MAKSSNKRNLARAGHQAYAIAWRDHAEPTNKQLWDKPTPPDDLWPHVVFSVGFLISQNDEIIEICRDLSEHGAVGACLHILKKEIVYMRPIKIEPVDKVGLF